MEKRVTFFPGAFFKPLSKAESPYIFVQIEGVLRHGGG
jgi:hypothetical protein